MASEEGIHAPLIGQIGKYFSTTKLNRNVTCPCCSNEYEWLEFADFDTLKSNFKSSDKISASFNKYFPNAVLMNALDNVYAVVRPIHNANKKFLKKNGSKNHIYVFFKLNDVRAYFDCEQTKVGTKPSFNGISIEKLVDQAILGPKHGDGIAAQESKIKHDYVKLHNVHMTARSTIHELYPVSARLGFNENDCGYVDSEIYKHIKKLRILNICSNLIINPDMAELGHRQEKAESGRKQDPIKQDPISKGIEHILKDADRAHIEFILAKPTKHLLKDMQKKIKNPNGASEAIRSAQNHMYYNLTKNRRYTSASRKGRFFYYVTDIGIPFGIFAVEYHGEYSCLNHVKIDLYSMNLSTEDNRRSMVIWEKTDKVNYDFFVNNFDDIRADSTLIKDPDEIAKMKGWVDDIPKWVAELRDEGIDIK